MQREYWKKQLKDAPHVPHIPMPSDFDRPITDDSLGEEIKVSVPADLVRSLKSLAIACGTTLFVTVLGAWKVRLEHRSPSFQAREIPERHLLYTHASAGVRAGIAGQLAIWNSSGTASDRCGSCFDMQNNSSRGPAARVCAEAPWSTALREQVVM